MKKKSYQKFVNATLVTALAASAVAVAAPTAEAAKSFPDVKKGEYYYDAVMELSERGVIKGFPDGTFKPNQSVTRGQAAKIIAGVLGLDTKNVKNPGFKDVSVSNEYFGAIAALENAGIISGYPDGTYRPTAPVQRNHMAKIIVNAFDLKASSNATTPFTDVLKEYEGYITALYENKVTTGRTPTKFDGLSNVTRGQLSAFVVRAENVLPKNATEALEKALADAEKIKKSDYTETSYKVLESAVDAAKKLDKNATDQQKLSAAVAINNAIKNLVKKEDEGKVTVVTASTSIAILADDVPIKIGVNEYTANIATAGTDEEKELVITFNKKVPNFDDVKGFEFKVSDYDFTAIKVDDEWDVALKQALELEGKSVITPVVKEDIENVMKKGIGLIGLKLDTADLSVLSADQVQKFKKENKNNVHEIIVGKNEVYDAQVTFQNKSLLGTVNFVFALYKANEDGEFEKIDSMKGKSTSVLGGGGAPSVFEISNLGEGHYIGVIEVDSSLALIDAFEYNLINQKVKDYSKAILSGNLSEIKGQAFSGQGTILEVNGKEITKENTVIQGQQGTLTISPNGKYTYEPKQSAKVGEKEVFTYEIGFDGLKSVEGKITITIEK